MESVENQFLPKIYISVFDFLRQMVYNKNNKSFRSRFFSIRLSERMKYMNLSDTSKVGLVLEGGGFRGIYTSGVLDYFMEQGLYLPHVYGVSAGALNAIGYAAKQPGRNAQINFRFCRDKRYLSAKNMIQYRCAFNLEFIFDVIPQRYIPFDYHTFFSSEVQVHAGATNLLNGKCEFFTKEQMDKKLFPVRASAALPLFSHTFYLNNTPYLDGGIACPIPIFESIRDQNEKHIIVLTKMPDFVRQPSANLPLIRRVYRNYPHFVNVEENRCMIDRRQRKTCALLAKTGQAFVLQPKVDIHISSMRADEKSLRALYAAGYEDAKAAFPQLLEFLQK